MLRPTLLLLLLLLLLLFATGAHARTLKVSTVRARVARTLAPLAPTAGLARAGIRLETDPLHGDAVVFTVRAPRGGPVRLRVSAERRRGRVLDLYVAPVCSCSATAPRPDRQRRAARAALRRLVPRRHRRFRLTRQVAQPDGTRELLYLERRPKRALAHFVDRALIVVGPQGALREASLTHVAVAVREPPAIDAAEALERTGGDEATLVVRHRRPGCPRPVWRIRRRRQVVWVDALSGAVWASRAVP